MFNWITDLFKMPYVTKEGFITRKNFSLLRGDLFIYTNGLCIVEDFYGSKYEVEPVENTFGTYRFKTTDSYELFLVAE